MSRVIMLAVMAWFAAVAAGQTAPFIGQQEAKLTASDAAFQDSLGRSVSLSGDTLVVGCWLDDNAGGVNAGSVYVFVRSGSTWSQQAKITAPDTAPGDRFGFGVAIDGETLIIGATSNGSGSGNAGAAYVFTRSGTTWAQQAKLLASDGQKDDSFGWSVDLEGDAAVVSAVFDDPAGAGGPDDLGSAYVFQRSGSAWTEQAKLTASDGAANDQFGYSVGISGSTVVIGSHASDAGGLSNAGAAYVFADTGSGWNQGQKLVASDPLVSALFGESVAIENGTILVGAVGDDLGVGFHTGSTYVFDFDGSLWVEQIKLVDPTPTAGANFGVSVALQDGVAAIGEMSDDTAAGVDAGSAHVFVCENGIWSYQSELIALDSAPGDSFGFGMAIDGDTVAVGAEGDDLGGITDAGAAYVFRLVTTGTWSDLGLGLAGTSGVPLMTGTGYLLEGTPASVSLAQAKPLSVAPLVIGLSAINAPFKGGTLVPMPDFVLPLFSDFSGTATLGTTWPAGVPAGFPTYLQWWVQDVAGPSGFAASNAVAATAP